MCGNQHCWQKHMKVSRRMCCHLAKSSALKMKLISADDLFSTEESRQDNIPLYFLLLYQKNCSLSMWYNVAWVKRIENGRKRAQKIKAVSTQKYKIRTQKRKKVNMRNGVLTLPNTSRKNKSIILNYWKTVVHIYMSPK